MLPARTAVRTWHEVGRSRTQGYWHPDMLQPARSTRQSLLAEILPTRDGKPDADAPLYQRTPEDRRHIQRSDQLRRLRRDIADERIQD